MNIIIHGPLEKDFLFKNLNKIRHASEDDHIIISVYNEELEKTKVIIDSVPVRNKVTLIGSDDVFNPGFFNINRQINLVSAALNVIEDESDFILKVRMDQTINFRWVRKVVTEKHEELKDKLITTNCYTRKDRLYHPSDMFLAGTKKTLRAYYPEEFFQETHMDNLLKIKELVLSGYKGGYHKYWPESRLFMNYLSILGEELQDTEICSQSQLKKHVYIFNSWDIGLKWKKFLKGKVNVLPYFFVLRPFERGPLENAENFLASDLTGYTKKPLREMIYNSLAKLYFKSGAYLANPIFIDYKSLIPKLLRKMFDHSYKFTPPILHNLMYKVAKGVYYAFK